VALVSFTFSHLVPIILFCILFLFFVLMPYMSSLVQWDWLLEYRSQLVTEVSIIVFCTID